MKTDFIYLKGILKKHNNNFFDTSCWEINRILYDKKKKSKSIKAVPGRPSWEL